MRPTQTPEAVSRDDEAGPLRTVFDAMLDGLLIADLQTKQLLLANPAICRMLGYSEAELLSMTVMDVHPTDDLAVIVKRLEGWAAGQRLPTLSTSVVRKDGTVVPVEVVSNALNWQGRDCVVGIFRDVAERKQAETALQQAHDELRAIYDGIVEGILIADAERAAVVQANQAYCTLLGCSEAEILALSPERVHPPEALPRVWEHLEAVKKGNLARIDGLPFLRKDGRIVFADVISAPIRFNNRPAWISFFHDVTAQKQAEETLQRQNRTLYRMLQSSDHERQLIAYEIHDELAQQLAGAIMQFQTFKHLRDKNPTQAGKAYDAGLTMLQQGHFEARRLIASVRHPILDEEGVVEAIAHLVHEQSRSAPAKIDYRSKVAFDRLAPALENAVYRIAQEGLANACEHSGSEKIRLSLTQHGDDLRLVIRDWGVGFNVKEASVSRFGLEGIRQRARLLGGRCRIRSSPGKGTRLTVELPIVHSHQTDN